MFPMYGWVIAFCCIVVGLGLYLAFLWTTAKYHVVNAPREQMFDCPVHGLFPKKYALDLGGGEPLEMQKSDGRTVREAFIYCPMCYEDRMKKARV